MRVSAGGYAMESRNSHLPRMIILRYPIHGLPDTLSA
jgi:hypothetical protein